MKKWIKRGLVGLVILAAAGAAYAWFSARGNGKAPSFTTGNVTRGELTVTIDATGTLEPEEVVDVGAQVSGQIRSFGTDADGKSIDYGSRVTKGMLLANIDEALATADVKQAEAQVNSAKAGVSLAETKVKSLKTKITQVQAQLNSSQAGVRRAEADLEQYKAKFAQAERDWARAQKLGSSEALSQATFDGYKSAYEAAKANVSVGEAAILQAKADVQSSESALAIANADVEEGEASLLQAKATLAQAETSQWRANRNLGYCTITSPVDGVVIDRRVNIGQTVASGLNTPSLFLIAKDLKRMQIWVAANEADVTKIRAGQPVSFTVDALADQAFKGTVAKVRPNASMTQNVVTYPVEIAVDNADGRLRPYLTANVKFQVDRRENVLMAPAAALRFTPSKEQVAPEFRDSLPAPKAPPAGMGAMPAGMPQGAPPGMSKDGKTPPMIYVKAGQFLKPILVMPGLSNGSFTEIAGEGISDGMEIVTGVEATAAGGPSADTSNPFAPKLPAPPKGGMPPR